MKKNKLLKSGFAFCLLALLAAPLSCRKVLDSEYRSELTPDYFSTPTGLEAGVTASYAVSRYFWGSEGFAYTACSGTDEVNKGGDGNDNFFLYNILPTDGSIQSIWNNSYLAINNLNGVLQYGPNANIDAARKTVLLGEAHFLRAFYYFLLVQNFGDVPLNLEFIQEPSTSATRQPIADVYEAIITDLTEASNMLPATSGTPSAPVKGRATKAAALHLLAKAYLTRGWSAAAQPDDFSKAYTTANDLITNRATYGLDLEQDFAGVFRDGNEYGKESIFVMDRNTDPVFSESGYNNTTAADGNKENRSNHYWVCFYTLTRNVNAGIPGAASSTQQVVTRDVANGRPFRRFRPTNYTYNAFSDRANDSRYDKTFQKVWIYNRPTSGAQGQDANNNPITITVQRGNPLTSYTWVKGLDTAIWMPGVEVTEAQRRASKAVIIAPSEYTTEWFPTMLKHLDITRPHFNDPSDRPIILFRLADTYLLAAEAALKDNRPADAATMINAVRQRAAYRSANTPAQNAAAVAAVTITGATVTLDYILDERTRELYGEYNRWYDLVRTRSLLTRVQAHNPISAAGIKSWHILRPIPQTQIDLVTTGPRFPQNEGY